MLIQLMPSHSPMTTEIWSQGKSLEPVHRKLNLKQSFKLLTMVSYSFLQLCLLGRFLLLQHTTHYKVSGLPVSVFSWSNLPENVNSFRSGVVDFDSIKVPFTIILFYPLIFDYNIPPNPHHILPTVIMPCKEYKSLCFSLCHFVVLLVTYSSQGHNILTILLLTHSFIVLASCCDTSNDLGGGAFFLGNFKSPLAHHESICI